MTDIFFPNLYYFCSRSQREIKDNLQEILRIKDDLLALSNPSITRLLKYIDPILSRVRFNTSGNLENPADVAIKFLEPEVLQQFVSDPTDVAARNALAEQVLLVSAGLGVLPDTEPYSVDELNAIDDGELSYYNEATFVYTWSAVASSPQNHTEYGGLIISQLTIRRDVPVNREEHDWRSAFLWAATVRAAWALFPFLDSEFQVLLLQYFFYQGFAVGAPVKNQLIAAVKNASPTTGISSNLILDSIDENKEIIPLQIDRGMGKTAGELIKNYLAHGGSLVEGGFVLEQFIGELYSGQMGRDAYAGWLREMFSTIFYFQTLKK